MRGRAMAGHGRRGLGRLQVVDARRGKKGPRGFSIVGSFACGVVSVRTVGRVGRGAGRTVTSGSVAGAGGAASGTSRDERENEMVITTRAGRFVSLMGAFVSVASLFLLCGGPSSACVCYIRQRSVKPAGVVSEVDECEMEKVRVAKQSRCGAGRCLKVGFCLAQPPTSSGEKEWLRKVRGADIKMDGD